MIVDGYVSENIQGCPFILLEVLLSFYYFLLCVSLTILKFILFLFLLLRSYIYGLIIKGCLSTQFLINVV
jgi:hypothetical protein